MYREEFQWPEGKKNAVMISLTLDAEYFGIAQYPEDKNAVAGFKTMAEFGVKKGLDRVLSVLDTYHVKATVFVPGKVAEEYPDAMKKIVEHGHEIGVHGYEHENFALLPEEKQKEAMEKSVEAVKEVCGLTPVGFRAPEGELTRRTLEIAKEAGIVYSSTLGNDDRPYYNVLNDQGTSILEIPFHWALFDAPYFAFHFWPPVPYGQGRISSFKKVLTNWKWEYDVFREEGLCYVLQLNPMTIGDPGKIYMLEELLTYIQKDRDVWFATGKEIYDYCEAVG